MIEKLEEAIKSMAKKSADAHDSGDAMRFAQAALNLANAVATLKHFHPG